MDQWKLWGKAFLFFVVGGVATNVTTAYQSGQISDLASLKGAALGGALTAAVAYLKLPHGAVDPSKDPAAK